MVTKKHVILEMKILHVQTEYGCFFEALIYEVVVR